MVKKSIIFTLLLIAILFLVSLYYFFGKSLKSESRDPLLRKIKTQGKIIVGTDATYPPLESIDEDGNFIGLDIEIAKEIAKDLGVKAEFQNIAWENLFDALREGEVDMIISAITITPERAEIMAFSDPYFNAGQVIVTKTEKAGLIRELADLNGRKIGVQIATTSEEEAKKYTDPDLVISYQNYDLAKEALSAGLIDFIIIDYPAAIGMVKKEKDFVIIGKPLTQEFYGIAVQIGQKALLEEINKTLKHLREEGKLKEMEERWLTQ